MQEKNMWIFTEILTHSKRAERFFGFDCPSLKEINHSEDEVIDITRPPYYTYSMEIK